jgi:hypothetical protein
VREVGFEYHEVLHRPAYYQSRPTNINSLAFLLALSRKLKLAKGAKQPLRLMVEPFNAIDNNAFVPVECRSVIAVSLARGMRRAPRP